MYQLFLSPSIAYRKKAHSQFNPIRIEILWGMSHIFLCFFSFHFCYKTVCHIKVTNYSLVSFVVTHQNVCISMSTTTCHLLVNYITWVWESFSDKIFNPLSSATTNTDLPLDDLDPDTNFYNDVAYNSVSLCKYYLEDCFKKKCLMLLIQSLFQFVMWIFEVCNVIFMP